MAELLRVEVTAIEYGINSAFISGWEYDKHKKRLVVYRSGSANLVLNATFAEPMHAWLLDHSQELGERWPDAPGAAS